MTAQNSSPEQLEQQAMRDFMARMQDPQVALEDARIEDEASCTIGAGTDWGDQLGSVITNPQGYYQHQRIQSLVMNELWTLLKDCDLGAGLSSAFAVGKPLLFKRLKQPSESVQQQLLAAFDDSMTPDGPKEIVPDSACSSVQKVIYTVLLEQDWKAMSVAATTAVQQSFMQRISLPKTA